MPNIADFADITGPSLPAPTNPDPSAPISSGGPSTRQGPGVDLSHSVGTISSPMAVPPQPGVATSAVPMAPAIDWFSLLESAQNGLNDSSPGSGPSLLKPTVDWANLGPAFLDLDAVQNEAELDPSGFPDALLMVMHLKVFIPLSMLTSSAISRIRFNDDLKFKKIPFGLAAGKWVLDDTHFPPESALSDPDYMLAHRHWIALVEATTESAIFQGWKAHHDKMVGDDLIRTSASAWRRHDRQLRSQFMIHPFIIDPSSSIYYQQFECIRLDLLSESFLTSALPRTIAPIRRTSSPSHASQHRPYDKDHDRKQSQSFQPSHEAHATLCVRCGLMGH